MNSVLRLLVHGTVALSFVFALAGWMGVRLAPAETGRAHLRADWYPSPIATRGPGYSPGEAARAEAPGASSSAPGAVGAPPRAVPAPRPAPTPTPRPDPRAALPTVRATGTGGQLDPLPPAAWLQDKSWLDRELDGHAPPPRGELRGARFFSRALMREVAYLAWLPPGYGTSGAAYPTLYLLHGAGSWEGHGIEEWLGYALTEDLEGLLSLQLTSPMIVILPEGEQGYWVNHTDGGPRWADFVAIDLVKHVDATFLTDARRERRAIGGLSMGGHGALQLALNHPDVFAVAGAHSPTLRPFELSPRFFGDEREFAQMDPLTLVQTTDAARRLLIWLDVGDDDRWRPEVEEVVRALSARNAPFIFHLLAGDHEGWYWEEYLPVYLRFYSAALSAREWSPQGAPIVKTLT
ncbi:MAG TPA: alpha/beta hydrolase-fold protein [Chloroflexota bacterium]|nr:alpha/beta hydrolase-fold protein [Chloroflexota bacterium]